VSIACSSGWFDGETDQDFLDLVSATLGRPNPFEDYENDCFAENITRLAGGGAIAIIAPSRPSHSVISGHLLEGIIQAIWPGHLECKNQPICEMGAALLFGKLYSATQWTGEGILQWFDWLLHPEHVIRTTFEEYHLFGDPETQLWTDIPSVFDVSYPESIGTSDPQKFVVTVRDNVALEPVPFAKVCVQQDPHIYLVGYTNPAGQIIFDVAPSDTPSFLNVTVTKHNYRPHIGVIQVRSGDVEVTLSQYTGSGLTQIDIWVFGFDEMYPVSVYFDEHLVTTISAYSQHGQADIPDGPNGYVNVWAAQGSLVATTRFYRLSTTLYPDPYIYSQYEPTTWYLAGGERVWDNPCITIYYGANPVTEVKQNTDYDVKVIVFNRGNGVADNTKVTLSYAPFGGGLSWTEIGSDYVTVNPFGSNEAIIRWRPLLPNTACLKVDLYNEDEKPEDTMNNMGQESLDIIPLCSPGTNNFQVGNPTNSTEYVCIKVKQKGNYDDIWNATILGYSSQAMNSSAYETVTLLVDPGTEVEPEESHLFIAEIYVNCELVGGMAFDATQSVCTPKCYCLCLLILGAILIIGVIVYRRRTVWELNGREIGIIIAIIFVFFLLECIGIIDFIPGIGEPSP